MRSRRASRVRVTVIAATALVALLAIGYFGFFARRASGQIGSIAVMPFVNASGNPDIEYLSDGVTESLINNLAQIPRLSVLASNIVFRYRGQTTDVQRVGQELNVRAVLVGKILLRSDHLTVSVELVNVTDGSRTWATGDFTYDGNVNFADLVKLAQNYNTALPADLPGASAGLRADLAAAVAHVPEPGIGAICAGVASALARRRRRILRR